MIVVGVVMPKKTNEPVATRRQPIDIRKKEEMLAVLIRNLAAFEATNEMFKITHCKQAISEPLGLVWKLVKKFHKNYGELPGKVQLESELFDALNENPDILDQQEREEVDEFLEFAWNDEEHGKNISVSKLHVRVATETCKHVLEELIAGEIHDRIQQEGTLPVDLPALLRESQQQVELIQSLTSIDFDEPFPKGWDQRPEAHLSTTGNATLDAFMGGGWRAGECLLFMAPYGSCKTTLVCDATSELILRCSEIYATGKGRKDKKGKPMLPVVVLVFTESDKDEYRNRLMAHLARVPWKKLADMASIQDLDNSDKPGSKKSTEYEKAEFIDKMTKDKENLTWENETTRINKAVKLANKHLILIDATAGDSNESSIGTGGMVEVANIVRGFFRKKKDKYPVAIWVDHLSGLVDRMGEVITDEATLRRVLSKMPLTAREKMGEPLQCPVGVMHQFAGANQNKGITAKLHHADAEGSKAIGKYANFCIVSGTVNLNQMCVWRCTKHRREPPSSERIVRVDGDFSRLVDVSHTHGIEPGRNDIQSKSDMETVAKLHSKKKKSGFDNQMAEV